jgi:DNA-binding response OmpR family regulator
MEQKHLFLVEDDLRLAELTQEYMEKQGFVVSHEVRGDVAVGRIIESQPDIVILDLLLPGLDGLEVYKQIKPDFNGAVLMLTAKDDDVDQILGLELGADDYVTKPVQPRLLLARVHALLRRYAVSNGPVNNQVFEFGMLIINQASRQVLLSSSEIELTTNEFELLWFLASHAGEVISRDQILMAVRGIEYDGLDRWVDIRISRLRNKLNDDAEHPQKIKTVWGKGYLFVEDAWQC